MTLIDRASGSLAQVFSNSKTEKELVASSLDRSSECKYHHASLNSLGTPHQYQLEHLVAVTPHPPVQEGVLHRATGSLDAETSFWWSYWMAV